MAKVTPITEHFQHFVKDLQESFWGDLQGQVQRSAKKFFELLSERQRDLYMVSPRYSRPERREDYRNGYYSRDFVTCFGTLRLRIARTRKKGFLPAVIKKFQRRAEEVALLIREAFLRGISTRQVGRVVGVFTGERVSPQTVSHLTQGLDQAVQQFHQARLDDDWAYLFPDGVSLRVRRPAGRKRVQMLVAYGVKRDGRRELLAFLRTRGESQADWEALLQDLFRRGLEGKNLHLIVTDGCPGLAAAIQTVYPRALHQRCWAHKMRNITEKVKKRDCEQVKADAPGDLPSGKPQTGSGGGPLLLPTLATKLSHPGSTAGTRPPGVAVVLRSTPAPMEEVTNDQYHRALLRGSPAPHSAHGLLRERAKRGSNHLLHFPKIQPGMEKSHPQAFYTRCLTSPLKEHAFSWLANGL